MYCLEEFYTNVWRWKIDKKEIEFKKLNYNSIDELYETQWSNKFEKYRKNRMVFGAFRYGDMRKQKKGAYSYVNYLKFKLNLYEQTGNLEMLCDIANLAMLEFVNGIHPNRHWPDTFESNIHCEKKE